MTEETDMPEENAAEMSADAPKKRGRPAKAADTPETFDCLVLRDFWTADEERVRAGTIFAADAATAMDGISSGILARVK